MVRRLHGDLAIRVMPSSEAMSAKSNQSFICTSTSVIDLSTIATRMKIVTRAKSASTTVPASHTHCKSYAHASFFCNRKSRIVPLLHSDRFGQVSREVNVETLFDGKPVSNQLKGNHVQETLEAVDRLGDFDLLCVLGREFRVLGVADDDWSPASSNHYG